MKQRLEWLSLLRGLTILLVVMNHVQLVDLSTGQNHAFCEWVSKPFELVRMPTFIFVSGGLLYLSRISAGWAVGRLYADKLRRIMLPFLFFVTFFFFFKLLFNSVVKTKVAFSMAMFFESFVIYADHPSAHLWFLATLMELMLLYPVFRWLCERDARMWVFGVFSILFYFVGFPFLADYNYFNIACLPDYLVFFFFGIAFFRYEGWRQTASWRSVLWLLAVYVAFYVLQVPLFTSLAGILVMVSVSQQLVRYLPGLFSSFREYIFPIYLMSFIFQPFVELVLWRRLFYDEHLFLLFYVLNVVAGIYGPVWVSHVAERIPFRGLRYCLGLNK